MRFVKVVLRIRCTALLRIFIPSKAVVTGALTGKTSAHGELFGPAAQVRKRGSRAFMACIDRRHETKSLWYCLPFFGRDRGARAFRPCSSNLLIYK
jgi:hypothetical protein